MINTQHISSGGINKMTSVVKEHRIFSELAQKMVNAAIGKARELGVSENVAILDDGGNLKAFSGWMGPRSRPSKWRKIKRTHLCSAFPRRTFSTLSRATHRFWPAFPRSRVWRPGAEDFPLRWTENLSERSG